MEKRGVQKRALRFLFRKMANGNTIKFNSTRGERIPEVSR